MDSESVLEDLLPNVWVFLAHIMATVILLIVCVWLVWNPTKKALKKRHDYIANEIAEAEKNKQEATKLLAEAEKTKLRAFDEANQIVDQAKQNAYSESEKITSEAQMTANQIQNNANLEAQKIKQEAKDEMNQQVMDLTFSISNALLKSKITKKDNDEYVADFIKELDKTDKKKGNK